MIRGAYFVDLYCDGCNKAMSKPPTRIEAFAEGACYWQARQLGWKLRTSRKRAICPDCAAKGVKC